MLDLQYFINNISQLLQIKIFDITLSKIIIALGIIFIILISKKFIKKILIRNIKFIINNKVLSKNISQSIDKPISFLILILGFFAASNIIEASGKVEVFVENINLSLFTIFFFWILNQVIEPLIFKLKGINKVLSKDLIEWFIAAIKFILIILGFSAVLELWGIKVAPIIAGLGLFGVAIALGAQDLFKNLISGILVLVEKRFKKGDVISIDGLAEGSVERIGFRSTTIRKFDKSLCFIPNSQFAEKPVTNITEITHRRIDWVIGLEYKTTNSQLKKICAEIEQFILKDKNNFFVSEATPIIVKVSEFADSSINIMVRCFSNTKDYNEFINVKNILALQIKIIVEKSKCSFAFPSQSLYIEKNS